MKRAVLLLVPLCLMSLLVSCNKNNIDDDVDVPYNYPSVHVCDAADLVHHAAVQPTATLNGNVEYWHCPECNTNYSDAAGTKVIEGNRIILPAGNYSISDDVLNLANDMLPFVDNGSSETKAVDKKAVVKTIFTIVGKVMEIKGQVDSRIGLQTLKGQIAELMEAIKEIQNCLDTIIKKNNEIMSKLASAPYQEEISEVNNILKEMGKRTVEIITSIHEILENNDELTEQVVSDIKYYADKWYNYEISGDSYETVTRRLLDDFQGKYIQGEIDMVSYPEILKECCKSYRVWEDDTYPDRIQFLRSYQITTGLCLMMLNIYRENCTPYGDAVNRKNDENNYLKMKEMISADSTRMMAAYNSYRAFRDQSKDQGKQITYLQLQPVKYDFSSWLQEVRTQDDVRFLFDNLGIMQNSLGIFLDKYGLKDPNAFISTEDIDYVFNLDKVSLDSLFRKHGIMVKKDVPIFGSYDGTLSGHTADYAKHTSGDQYGYECDGQIGFIHFTGQNKNHRAGGLSDHYIDNGDKKDASWGRYMRYGHIYNHTARDNDSNRKLCSMYDHYYRGNGTMSCIMARDFRWTYTWSNGAHCDVGDCSRAWSEVDAVGDAFVGFQQTIPTYTGEKYDD